MTDEQRGLIEDSIREIESRAGIVWTAEFLEDYAAALRALLAENAALKAQPVSNSDELASIPLKSWVIEVFHHLCHSPHTPDEWKRDLDRKTQALLNAIDRGKKEER